VLESSYSYIAGPLAATSSLPRQPGSKVRALQPALAPWRWWRLV